MGNLEMTKNTDFEWFKINEVNTECKDLFNAGKNKYENSLLFKAPLNDSYNFSYGGYIDITHINTLVKSVNPETKDSELAKFRDIVFSDYGVIVMSKDPKAKDNTHIYVSNPLYFIDHEFDYFYKLNMKVDFSKVNDVKDCTVAGETYTLSNETLYDDCSGYSMILYKDRIEFDNVDHVHEDGTSEDKKIIHRLNFDFSKNQIHEISFIAQVFTSRKDFKRYVTFSINGNIVGDNIHSAKGIHTMDMNSSEPYKKALNLFSMGGCDHESYQVSDISFYKGINDLFLNYVENN